MGLPRRAVGNARACHKWRCRDLRAWRRCPHSFFCGRAFPDWNGLSVADYLASFATAPGIISLLMFVLFAAMPTLASQPARPYPHKPDYSIAPI